MTRAQCGAPDSTAGERWALLIEYDGTGFAGWQRQANSPSVQQAIEEALERLTGEKARILGAGRTDAGVHALGQVASFLTRRSLNERTLTRGLNSYLPPSARIRAARRVDARFNPRREARMRWYRYRLASGGVAPALERTWRAWTPARLDWERVEAALEIFRGRHDFSAFRAAGCDSPRTLLTLKNATLRRHPRGADGGESGWDAEMDFHCRSFLRNMVRLLAGAAIEAGRGRLSLDTLRQSLDSGERGEAHWPPAPASGLCLISVEYPAEWNLWPPPEERALL